MFKQPKSIWRPLVFASLFLCVSATQSQQMLLHASIPSQDEAGRETEFAPPPAPAWHPFKGAPVGIDLNGVWTMNRGNSVVKVLLVEWRNEFWGTNLQNFPYLAPGENVLKGTYSDAHEFTAGIYGVTQAGRLAWQGTKFNTIDANTIRFAGDTFHRESSRIVRDTPCNPANPNHVEAETAFSLGQLSYKVNDLQAANCWFYVAATQSHPEGEASYAYSLLQARGIGKDTEQAVYWFQRAAMHNSFNGLNNLSVLFGEGQLVPHSDERRRYWEKRAQATNPEFVHDGIHNVEPAWMTQVSPPCAISDATRIDGNEALARGIAAYQARVMITAACWFTISAKRGNAHANVYLGIQYTFGWGVAKNRAAALGFMKRAADAGDWFGNAYLSEFYRLGLNTPVDIQKAVALREKAENDGREKDNGGWAAFVIASGLDIPDEAHNQKMRDAELKDSEASTKCNANKKSWEAARDCNISSNFWSEFGNEHIVSALQNPEEIYPEYEQNFPPETLLEWLLR